MVLLPILMYLLTSNLMSELKCQLRPDIVPGRLMELQDDDEYKTLVFSDSYIQISPDALQFEGELARRDVLKTLHLYFL